MLHSNHGVSTQFNGPWDNSTQLGLHWDNSTQLFGGLAAGVAPDDYFYLYRISYAWYSLLGFLLTVVVGRLVSALRTWCTGKPVLVENKLLAAVAKRRPSDTYSVGENSHLKNKSIAECSF